MRLSNQRLNVIERRVQALPAAVKDESQLSDHDRDRLLAETIRGTVNMSAAVKFDPVAGAWVALHYNAHDLADCLNRFWIASNGFPFFPLLAADQLTALAMLDAGRWRLQVMGERSISIIGWPNDHDAWSHGAMTAAAVNVALAQIEPTRLPRDLAGLRALLVDMIPIDGLPWS